MTPVGSRRNSIDGSDTEKPSLAQNVPSSAPSSAATPRFPSLVPKSGRPVDRVAFLRQSVRDSRTLAFAIESLAAVDFIRRPTERRD